jgi:flagellar biosynthesis protein FlhG
MPFMPDQATTLRELMQREAATIRQPASRSSSAPRVLAIASGKGGVGKSHIALNLSLALAEQGHSVCLLDAGESSGPLQVLCGSAGYWNLSHVAAGARSVREVALQGPGGIRVLTAAGVLLCSDPNPIPVNTNACRQLAEFLEQFDHVVIDIPTGKQSVIQRILQAVDALWLITVPELTSVAETYSLLKDCVPFGPRQDWEILVNQAESGLQAREIVNRIRTTVQSFLNCDVFSAGHIPFDRAVSTAVMQRQPFYRTAPNSAVSQAVKQLAGSWSARSQKGRGKFLEHLAALHIC